MRQLFTIISLTFFLVACSFFPQKYDNNEYQQIARIQVLVENLNELCRETSDNSIKKLLSKLKFETRVLEVYASNTPNNEEVARFSQIIANDIRQFEKYYRNNTHNKFYCEKKSKLVLKKIHSMNKIIPNKER